MRVYPALDIECEIIDEYESILVIVCIHQKKIKIVWPQTCIKKQAIENF